MGMVDSIVFVLFKLLALLSLAGNKPTVGNYLAGMFVRSGDFYFLIKTGRGKLGSIQILKPHVPAPNPIGNSQ